MDGRKVTREIRLEHWSRVIQDCRGSLQTIKDYCAAQGIKENVFYYWQKQLRETALGVLAGQGETAIAPVFAEVRLDAGKRSTGTIIVRLSGAEVEISGDANPEAAASVIRALREKGCQC